jgi:hypothetical protein
VSVYVDLITTYPEAIIAEPARRFGTRWCHMWADTETELDAMADRIGLSRRHIQDAGHRHLRHYDLVPSKRRLAMAAGAVEMSLREYLRERMGVG